MTTPVPRCYNEFMNKKTCQIMGCDNVARNKGSNTKGIIYGNKCSKHHRQSSKLNSKDKKRHFDNKKCEECGWNKAFCDRHRIKKEVGYRKGNVVILCPNCHRLITLGLLTLSEK